ncbi:LysR substrate-binding domain-containing protein [Colwellia sp. RE-S-Sl-9]
MKLPPLKSLSFFLAAARNKSFKGAAQELFVTQAAVSQQIRLLEENLKCQLFIRDSKQTLLSTEGKRLFPFIEKAFSEISQGISLLSAEPDPNTLKITSLHSFTSLILIPKINEFQLMYPEMMLQFSPSNQLVDFKDNNVDIAIRRGKGIYQGLESRELIKDEVLLVASSLLFEDAFPSMDILLKTPMLLDISSDLKPAFELFCNQYKVTVDDFKISLQTTDSVPVIEKTIAGQGMCFVSKSLVFERIKEGTLINLFEFSANSPISLFLVAPPKNFQWEKVKKFEAWLKVLFNSG